LHVKKTRVGLVADFLIPQEKYLESGAHIGTRTKHGSMREFIYKAREDGLHVLDLKKLDERVKSAAMLLAKYDAAKVFVVGNKDNAVGPIKKMCELTGFQPLGGRFTPGRFTNPSRDDFCEPSLVLMVDPSVDRQAIREAYTISTPIISLCDTNNSTRYLDLVIPTNNKGRKALALIFWILTREVLKIKGTIQKDEEFTSQISDFE